MKLKELNEAIASTCNVRGQVVNAVQSETFRQLRAALDKGERVIIPEFGMFIVKETPGEDGKPATKTVRFREKKADEEGKKKREGGGGGGRKKKAEAASDDED